jgi:hypothetical protein
MLRPEGRRIVVLADQVWCVLERPCRARPPGLDLDLVAELAQVLSRRPFWRQGRTQDLGAAAEADGRILDAVPQRGERGPQVQRASQAEAAGG